MKRSDLFGIAVACAIAIMTLDVDTAEALMGPDHGAELRAHFPAFVLDRGRFEGFEASDPAVLLFAGDVAIGFVLDRGRVV